MSYSNELPKRDPGPRNSKPRRSSRPICPCLALDNQPTQLDVVLLQAWQRGKLGNRLACALQQHIVLVRHQETASCIVYEPCTPVLCDMLDMNY